MTNFKLGRWLLVALAIVGLAFAAPAVSAHGNGTAADNVPTADNVPPSDASADDWTVWMEAQMTEHTGPGGVEWMESITGVAADEMGQYMTGADHNRGMGGHSGTDGHNGAYGHSETDGHNGAYGQGAC